MRLNIKPLSVNQCWQGRRFKTPKYKKYQNDLLSILPDTKVPDGFLRINITFGFSSASSDFDNPVKPFVDCLQKKYGFNDKYIKECFIRVEKVSKGNEFIHFQIKGIDW